MRFQFLQVLFVLGLFGASVTAKAQTYLQNVGVPPFTTKLPVENGFINAANGNLHLEIPLGSFPQRGGPPDKIVLMYDSAFWSYAANGYWQSTNISDPNQYAPVWGGWRIVTSRDAGNTTYSEYDYGNCAWAQDYTYARYSPWYYVAPDGTQHTFPVTTLMPFYPGHCGNSGTPTAAGYANDGSGFYISITNYTAAIVYAPDGTILAGNSIDTNGNYAGYNGIDTLGRTLLTQTNNAGVYTLQVPNSQGGQSTYTVRTSSIYVCTNFGQQYVGEWCNPTNPLTITVVNEVDLPDGTKYTFTYDSGTAAGHYGTLTSMTLPTGGTINYTFGVFQDASINADGTKNKYLWITSRTTPDGVWGYGQQVLSNCAVSYQNCQQQFTVTKPVVPPATTADQIVYTFTLNGGDWPTQVQYNDHATGSLATTNQCFNFVTVSNGTCSYNLTSGTAATNVHLVATTTTLPIPSGSVSATTQYASDQYGNPTSIQEWNFGNSPSNAADRITSISYLTGAAYQPPNANILNRPTDITVTNKAGTTVAHTIYGYDVYTYNGGSLAGVTAAQHDANYSTNITARGNVTSIQNLVGSTWLTSYFNYDTTGQVTNAFDPSNQKTTNVYTCQNAYPNTITNPLGQVTTNGYDCNTGFLTSVKDANNQSTSFGYDNMFRPLSVSFPDGGSTSIQYNFANGFYTGSTTTKKVTSTQNLVTTDTVDGLGRVASSVTSSDPDGSTTVTTSFDTNGRVQSTSNPYRGTFNGSESYVYDGLGRVMQVTHVDGHVSSVYYGASVGAQGGAASQLCAPGTYNAGYPILKIDEANNKLQSWIDGLGRTIEADEPTATSASLTANTCYGYDANNNLTGVLAAGGIQTRTYSYDGLSRLTQAIDPETGGNATPSFYNYDADTNCALPNSFPGDLVSRVDPRGVRTCMQYDALHRLTAKIYSDGTPAAYYYYDQSAPWGSPLTNYIGRLTTEGTYTAGKWVTESLYSYDPMGRVAVNQQCTPVNCGTSAWTLNYSYDYLGNMATYTNGAGVTFTQSPFNGAGRLTQVTSSLSDSNHPATLLTNVHYNALGEPNSATLGNGAVETLGYTPRGWPLTTSVASQSTGTPGTGTVTINGSEQSRPPQNLSQGPNGVTTASGYWEEEFNNSGQHTGPVQNSDVTSIDNARANWTAGGYGGTAPKDFFSGNLFLRGLGFSVPGNATITGIQVDAYVESAGPYSLEDIYDYNIQLLNASAAQVGTNHASGIAWPYTEGWKTWGSSTDTWAAGLTPTDINSPNFGVSISVTANLTGGCGYIDYASGSLNYARITVWYTTPTTYDSGSVTITVNGSTTQPVPYSNGSTGVSIAGQLAGEISAFGFVTASNNNTNVITIQSTTNGSNTNYPLSASSQSGAGFNPPSFTTALSNVSPCGSGSCLTGGTGAPGTLYSFSLGYGAGNSNVTSANDSVDGNWVFTYDYLNRLSTSYQNNTNGCSYGYDQLGNRTSKTATAGSCGQLSLSYTGNNNRMDGYSYDLAGNLLGDGTHTYAYDAENRLISVDNGNTASYVYDAEGRRVQKTATAQVEYVYDLNGNTVTELSSAGAWNRGEIFANGQHIATYNNGTTYFNHADWLGTERARSNMGDANCETITNQPYGDGPYMSGNCVDANPLHFTGQQWDPESGLHYFPARHYSTQFGRFMSPDPTGIFLGNLNDPQSLNLYAYVRNNSSSMTDPSGLCDDFDCGGDFCIICIGIGWGGGGGNWDWGGGPAGPQNFPANIGLNPNPSNGTSTSDDPFSGETNGIPNGLQIPTRDLAGMLGIEMPDPWIFSVNPNYQGQNCLNVGFTAAVNDLFQFDLMDAAAHGIDKFIVGNQTDVYGRPLYSPSGDSVELGPHAVDLTGKVGDRVGESERAQRALGRTARSEGLRISGKQIGQVARKGGKALGWLSLGLTIKTGVSAYLQCR